MENIALFMLDILDYVGNILFLFMLMLLFLNKSVIVRMPYMLVLTVIVFTILVVSEYVVGYVHLSQMDSCNYFPHPLIGWSQSLISSTLIVLSIVYLEKKFEVSFFFKEVFLVVFMAFYIEFLFKWIYFYELDLYPIRGLFCRIPLGRDETFFYVNLLVLLWGFKSEEKELLNEFKSAISYKVVFVVLLILIIYFLLSYSPFSETPYYSV